MFTFVALFHVILSMLLSSIAYRLTSFPTLKILRLRHKKSSSNFFSLLLFERKFFIFFYLINDDDLCVYIHVNITVKYFRHTAIYIWVVKRDGDWRIWQRISIQSSSDNHRAIIIMMTLVLTDVGKFIEREVDWIESNAVERFRLCRVSGEL